MMMIEKIYTRCSEALPVIGGAGGAASQIERITQYFPSWETVISSIIITVIGAVTGYLVKVLLDIVFKKKMVK